MVWAELRVCLVTPDPGINVTIHSETTERKYFWKTLRTRDDQIRAESKPIVAMVVSKSNSEQ